LHTKLSPTNSTVVNVTSLNETGGKFIYIINLQLYFLNILASKLSGLSPGEKCYEISYHRDSMEILFICEKQKLKMLHIFHSTFIFLVIQEASNLRTRKDEVQEEINF
jgi:hypothetical protein